MTWWNEEDAKEFYPNRDCREIGHGRIFPSLFKFSKIDSSSQNHDTLTFAVDTESLNTLHPKLLPPEHVLAHLCLLKNFSWISGCILVPLVESTQSINKYQLESGSFNTGLSLKSVPEVSTGCVYRKTTPRKFGWVSEENNRFIHTKESSHASYTTCILIRLPNPLHHPTYSWRGKNNFKDGIYINTHQLCLCINGFLGITALGEGNTKKKIYVRKKDTHTEARVGG